MPTIPDNPSGLRDRTPLKKGQITTGALRHEHRRDTNLPILLSDEVLRKQILRGIEDGIFVYVRAISYVGRASRCPACASMRSPSF